MTRLERIQKYLIVTILLLTLVVAGGLFLMIQHSPAAPDVSSDQEENSEGTTELTEVEWYYPDHVLLGQPLTSLSFETPDGQTTSLQDHLGDELTLAMYWGSWCQYCEEQTDVLLSMTDKLEANDIKVLLIDKLDPEKESISAASEKIADKQIPFDWIVDGDLSVYTELGMHIIPTSFLLDADGRVLYCHAGTIRSEEEFLSMISYAQNGASSDTEQFVRNQLLTDDGGVRMNVNTSTSGAPSGHDILSESQGLLMEYANLSGDTELFDLAYSYVKNKLDVNDLMRWYATDRADSPARVNALLDDLRVLNALSDQQQTTGGYTQEIASRAEAIAQYNFDSDGHLIDFYTFEDGTRAHQITMCYLDWQALSILEEQIPWRKSSIEAAAQILDGAYLGDEFPFYANFYDYEKQSYDTGSLNMAEAMLTLLHQAEAGKLPDASLAWLKKQMSGNGIWARYDIHGNVVPGYNYQTPSIYAITGLIALVCDDQELLTQSVSRMEDFRCFSEGDPLNGAFAETLDGVSSFDQCMALILYAKMNHH